MSSPRPPVVTDASRQWALDKCPAWAVRGAVSLRTDDEPRSRSIEGPAIWDLFVAEQAESFESFFAHERRAPVEWARLWRTWFGRADAAKRFPKASRPAAVKHPFCRAGSPEFDRALTVATAKERFLFRRIGVAQFKPDDPRVERVFVA